MSGEKIDQFSDTGEPGRISSPYLFDEAVDPEQFVVHKSDVLQKYIIRDRFVVVLVGVPVDQHFDILVQVFQFHLEHSEKYPALLMHKVPHLMGVNVTG